MGWAGSVGRMRRSGWRSSQACWSAPVSISVLHSREWPTPPHEFHMTGQLLPRMAYMVAVQILQWVCGAKFWTGVRRACGAKFCSGVQCKILNWRAAQNFAPAYGAKFWTGVRRKILHQRTAQKFVPACGAKFCSGVRCKILNWRTGQQFCAGPYGYTQPDVNKIICKWSAAGGGLLLVLIHDRMWRKLESSAAGGGLVLMMCIHSQL